MTNYRRIVGYSRSFPDRNGCPISQQVQTDRNAFLSHPDHTHFLNKTLFNIDIHTAENLYQNLKKLSRIEFFPTFRYHVFSSLPPTIVKHESDTGSDTCTFGQGCAYIFSVSFLINQISQKNRSKVKTSVCKHELLDRRKFP